MRPFFSIVIAVVHADGLVDDQHVGHTAGLIFCSLSA
jgi:hypothetical protein